MMPYAVEFGNKGVGQKSKKLDLVDLTDLN